MYRKISIVTALLLSVALVAGCNQTTTPEELAGQGVEVAPLDNDAWPTPHPTSIAPTPTPFATHTLADITGQQSQARDDQPARSASPTPTLQLVLETKPTPAVEVAAKSDPIQPVQAVALVSDRQPVFKGLGVVATVNISRPEVDVRPLPTMDSAEIDELTDDRERLEVLALDSSGEWALIDPEHQDSRLGWVVVADLALPEEAIGQAPRIHTAWTTSNGLTVRQGPALFHDEAGKLNINTMLVLLGRNADGTWANIQTLDGGGRGWVRFDHLDVRDPITDLPLAPEPPAAPTPASTRASRPLAAGPLVIQRESGGEILVINRDGTGLRTLTTGIDPAMSPDGRQVAFTRWEQGEAGQGTLWVVNLDGSGERPVLGFISKQPKGPAWSPDGSQIVINFQQGGNPEHSTECHDLTEGEFPRPPRGAEVEFDIDDSGDPVGCFTRPPNLYWQLKVVDVASGEFEDSDGGSHAFRPTWDPLEPWRVVSDGGRGLAATDITRDETKPLTDNLTHGSPSFSPDGQYIVFTAASQRGSKGYDIFRLNRDGSGLTRLTSTPLWHSTLPNNDLWNHVSPIVTPDGDHIAYVTDRSGRWEVWLMNLDGSNQRPLFSDEVQAALNLTYNFVDERMISWR